MTILTHLASQAIKDILEKNLSLYEKEIFWKPCVLIYDTQSSLSTLISYGYKEHLLSYPYADVIDFDVVSKEELKEKILSLPPFSTVIMVQSTNFRLEDFRIRILLQQKQIACIEHNHLSYIKETELQTYLEAMSYQSDYFEIVSDFLQQKFTSGNTMKIIASDGGVLIASWGFEEMKQNTGKFPLERRYGSYPIGENFTEVKDFAQVNGELTIAAYPGEDLQVIFPEKPFKIFVKESKIIAHEENTPQDFLKILEKIQFAETDIMMRELGFWLNRAITFDKPLSDVNAFERVSWFHLSLGKKHNIYRKKFPKDEIQRYHIDIFPEVAKILLDDEVIYEKEKHYLC